MICAEFFPKKLVFLNTIEETVKKLKTQLNNYNFDVSIHCEKSQIKNNEKEKEKEKGNIKKKLSLCEEEQQINVKNYLNNNES